MLQQDIKTCNMTVSFLPFQSKPAKVVHFPVNILSLRTVHKYERMDSFEEDNDSAQEEPQEGDDTEDAEVVSGMWSRDYPIASEEPGEDVHNFPVEKDFDSLDSNSAEANGTVVANDVPLPDSPVEKKIRKAARRRKLEECGQEWVAAIDSYTENTA